jgi:hypothetical protein
MLLRVSRFEESADGAAAIGRWWTDRSYRAFTLEDRVREMLGFPVERWKIPGETAIPVGKYPVTVDKSERFSLRASEKFGRPIQVWTIHVLDVPGYSGIRVHGANRSKELEGCIAPGLSHPEKADYVGGSRAALDMIQPEVEAALGLVRVPGPPECWSAGTVPKTVWHYEQSTRIEDVYLEITTDFTQRPSGVSS